MPIAARQLGHWCEYAGQSPVADASATSGSSGFTAVPIVSRFLAQSRTSPRHACGSLSLHQVATGSPRSQQSSVACGVVVQRSALSRGGR